MDFLPAAQNDTWETVFPAAMDTVLEDVEDKYDYILLDCPAGRGEGIRFAEHLSDHMFLVVAPSWASKRNAERLMTGPRKRYMTYVLNQFSLSGDTQISLTDMLETLDEESVSAIIPYTEEADRLAHQGELSDFPKRGARRSTRSFLEIVQRRETDPASALEEAAPESRSGECAGEGTCEDGVGWSFLALGQPLV